ncbi:MAG TPA: pseudouridine synthase [Kiritimatiellia bacterium]|nr:pseudouridine synthase [Kiritimatiellia bacterium]
MIRLQKYLAECGVASRRAAERLIEQGVVTVDGEVERHPGTVIDPSRQAVRVDGKRIKPEAKVVVALNKPVGVVCTSDDPGGRPKAIDLVQGIPGRLYSVGRLDANSEGLLLVTNDGDLAFRMTHPRHHVVKTYLVWTGRSLKPYERKALVAGIRSEGELLKALSISPEGRDAVGFRYRMELGEGKNRQIRRMFAGVDARVLRLQRIAMGPVALGRLKEGTWRKLLPREIEALYRVTGLAEEA